MLDWIGFRRKVISEMKRSNCSMVQAIEQLADTYHGHYEGFRSGSVDRLGNKLEDVLTESICAVELMIPEIH